MGFLPNLNTPEPGDFTQVYAKINELAAERNIPADDPQVLAVKKLVVLVNEFHQGFLKIMEREDEEGDRLLNEAAQRLSSLDPAHNEIDRLLIASLVSGVAAQISPENLAKGKGFDFL